MTNFTDLHKLEKSESNLNTFSLAPSDSTTEKKMKKCSLHLRTKRYSMYLFFHLFCGVTLLLKLKRMKTLIYLENGNEDLLTS